MEQTPLKFEDLIGQKIMVRTKLAQPKAGDVETVELAGTEPSGIWIKVGPRPVYGSGMEERINELFRKFLDTTGDRQPYVFLPFSSIEFVAAYTAPLAPPKAP